MPGAHATGPVSRCRSSWSGPGCPRRRSATTSPRACSRPRRKLAANRFLYDERHVELVRLSGCFASAAASRSSAIAALLPELLPDLLDRPGGGVFRPGDVGDGCSPARPSRAAASCVGERVLHAAVAAFARHGYAEVTVDDVCRAAGIAKGSFYRYFASKEELFLAAARPPAPPRRRASSSALAGTLLTEEAGTALAEAIAPEVGDTPRPRRAGLAASVPAPRRSSGRSTRPSGWPLGDLAEDGVARGRRRRGPQRSGSRSRAWPGPRPPVTR